MLVEVTVRHYIDVAEIGMAPVKINEKLITSGFDTFTIDPKTRILEL